MGVPVKRGRRGGLLVAALIVFGLFEVLALVMNFLDWRTIVTHGQSAPGVPLGAMVMAVVALVALAGVWSWQRQAVYLLAVVVAVSAVYDAWFGLAALALLVRLVLVAALAWRITVKWASFR